MLDPGLIDALVAFNELTNGDSVITVVRPMFMMASVNIYLLMNRILLDLVESYVRYAFGLILILLCQHSLAASFIRTYISQVTTTTPAMRVQ